MSALWPAGRDYVEAIGSPGRRGPADLREAVLREGLFGLPASASGQNAIVFPLEVDGRAQALKCFTTPPDDAVRQRYRLLELYLRALEHSPLVVSEWCEHGLLIGDRWWPAVRMPWLPGDTLDLAIEARLDDPVRLRRLGRAVRRKVVQLGVQRLAHGDLQHGNLLVDGDEEVYLVDYDAVWFPGAETLGTNEVGHRNYQHRDRLRTGRWDSGTDTFAGLVIYQACEALAVDPSLWERHHRGENLLLAEDDFANPHRSAALDELGSLDDDGVRCLTDAVRVCANAPLASLPPFAELMVSIETTGKVALLGDVNAPGALPNWIRDDPGDAGVWSAVDADWVAAPPSEEFDFDPSRTSHRRRLFGRRRGR